MTVLNKVDITRLEELPSEKREVLKDLESNESVPLIEMSTVTDFGVMDVKNEACERLLAFRVDQKMKSKKVIVIRKFLVLHKSNPNNYNV